MSIFLCCTIQLLINLFFSVLLSLYALYIIVVAFSRCVYVRKAHRRSTISRFSKYDSLDNDDDEDVEAKICRNNNNDKYGTFAVEGTDEPKSQHHSCGSTPSSSPHSTNDIFTFSIQKVSELDSEDDENEEVDEVESEEKDDTKENIPTIAVPVIRRRCKVFKKQNCFFKNGTTTLQHFSAIDLQNWRKSGYLGKAYQVFAAVPNFCLNLCIPTVDEERLEGGWSQLLICINIFLAPQAVYFLLDCKFLGFKKEIESNLFLVFSGHRHPRTHSLMGTVGLHLAADLGSGLCHLSRRSGASLSATLCFYRLPRLHHLPQRNQRRNCQLALHSRNYLRPF